MKTVNGKYMFECDVCEGDYQHGPGVYEGYVLGLYGGAACCKYCWEGNWDGWSPHHEPAILEICKQRDVPVPARNKDGWLPRGGVKDGYAIQGDQPEFNATRNTKNETDRC